MCLPMYKLTATLATLQLAQCLLNSSPSVASGVDSVYKSGEGAYVDAPSVNATKEQEGVGNCYVEPYAVPVQTPSLPPFDQTRAHVFRYRQQQGVNLGSWFVHEQWMTPSVFRCAADRKFAEIDIAGGWGGLANAKAVLERHYDTFITADDFKYLADIGINTVRMPIGYWTLGSSFMIGTPFEKVAPVYEDAWPRFMRAVIQAGDAGLGVLVDLHGAAGSQNGQHHSGVSDGQSNLFKSPDYQAKTLEVLKYLVHQLGPIPNVVGIQLLNEPDGDPSLEDFYTHAISVMRDVSPHGQDMPLYIHDAFNIDRFVPFVANRRDFVVQDHHSYFVFTPGDSAEPANQHTRDIQGGIADGLRKTALGERRNLILGEWSCALTEESLSHESDTTQAQRDFCTAQMQVYAKNAAGWYFWSYKNEQCWDDMSWCFQRVVGTVLPSTFFSYDAMNSTSQVLDASTKASGLSPPTDDEISSILDQSPRGDQKQSTGDLWKEVQHRFEAIHEYQATQGQFSSGTNNTRRSSSVKGFRDGHQTAKVFAMYSMSKLGFIEQYINDVISRAGPNEVPSGTEGDYSTGFRLGLDYGERKVWQL